MALKLTERSVAALAPPDRGALTIWDSDLARFGVRVSQTGGRSFFINYRSRADGRERRHTIGTFGVWTTAAARAKAVTLLRAVDTGEDPQAERAARRAAPTVADLADRYIRDHLPRKSPKSQTDDRKMIENEILPRLGARKVGEVNFGDIEAMHRAISARINPRTGEGCTVLANHVLALASKMFSLSLLPMANEDAPWRDKAQGNPCQGVQRNPEHGVERFFSPAEIAALSDAIAARGRTPAVDCVRLIMLTGCRPGEAQSATWDQFDVEPGKWVKPSSHTKQRRVHRVPLSPGAIALLDQIRKARPQSARAKANPFVFPGQRPGEPIKQLRTTWEDLSGMASVGLWRAAKDPKISRLIADLESSQGRRPTAAECQMVAKLRGVDLPPHLTDARLYDCRHSFASLGAGRGMSLQIIGKLLGHTQARTTQRYAHLADDALKDAVDSIGAVIAEAGKGGAKIVPMRGAR